VCISWNFPSRRGGMENGEEREVNEEGGGMGVKRVEEEG
jgi:hypothetical protein